MFGKRKDNTKEIMATAAVATAFCATAAIAPYVTKGIKKGISGMNAKKEKRVLAKIEEENGVLTVDKVLRDNANGPLMFDMSELDNENATQTLDVISLDKKTVNVTDIKEILSESRATNDKKETETAIDTSTISATNDNVSDATTAEASNLMPGIYKIDDTSKTTETTAAPGAKDSLVDSESVCLKRPDNQGGASGNIEESGRKINTADLETDFISETTKLLKKQNNLLVGIFAMVGGMFLVALISAILIVPHVLNILVEGEKTVAQVQDTITVVQTEIDNLKDVEQIVADLSKVSKEIADTDIPGLISKTETLVDQSGDGIADAVSKLDSIDIESLNTAINDLKSVVEPMAKMFGRR